MSKTIYFLLFIAALISGAFWFCEKQTKGFRYYLLLSDLPNSPAWETPSLQPEEKSKIDTLLGQPFTFLGRGGWCVAFLGQDQKTVLKLFKHDHLKLSQILKKPTLDHLLLRTPSPSTATPPHFEKLFHSIMLLYQKMAKETGLLYVHLNKTQGEHRQATLIDNCGIHHRIDLDATEFVLQKKAEQVYKHLNNQIRSHNTAGAKQSIDALLRHLLAISSQGLRDTDKSIGFNFGFNEDGPMTIDIGSFVEDETIKTSSEYKKELLLKTMNLNPWLKKRDRALQRFYVDRLVTLIEEQSFANGTNPL